MVGQRIGVVKEGMESEGLVGGEEGAVGRRRAMAPL